MDFYLKEVSRGKERIVSPLKENISQQLVERIDKYTPCTMFAPFLTHPHTPLIHPDVLNAEETVKAQNWVHRAQHKRRIRPLYLVVF